MEKLPQGVRLSQQHSEDGRLRGFFEVGQGEAREPTSLKFQVGT